MDDMRTNGIATILILAACASQPTVYGSLDAGAVAIQQGAKQRAYAIQRDDTGVSVHEIAWTRAPLDLPEAVPDERPAMSWPSPPPEDLTDAEVWTRIWDLWRT